MLWRGFSDLSRSKGRVDKGFPSFLTMSLQVNWRTVPGENATKRRLSEGFLRFLIADKVTEAIFKLKSVHFILVDGLDGLCYKSINSE